jgi:glycosyltransferase involved in cell wall biosynthesis
MMNSSEKLVSIVLPTYNGASYLRESIESCIKQTYQNLEIIIVDDGSTEETKEILSNYSDPRIHRLDHSTNRGLPAALNTGFSYSHGDFLTWTSDDNLYVNSAIEVMVGFLENHPEVGLVRAQYWEIDDQGKIIRLLDPGPIENLKDMDTIGACFMYRRSVYEKIGSYNENARLVEDYEYWLRVSQWFTILPLDQSLYYYRVHNRSLTSQTGVIHERWRLGIQIKRQLFGWSFHRYNQEMAKVDIDEAFACYGYQKFSQVPGLVLKGVARDPRWLFNRGVSSIAIRAILRNMRS